MNEELPCKMERRDSRFESGVDLNRNYDFKFACDEEGSVADPCDEIY